MERIAGARRVARFRVARTSRAYETQSGTGLNRAALRAAGPSRSPDRGPRKEPGHRFEVFTFQRRPDPGERGKHRRAPSRNAVVQPPPDLKDLTPIRLHRMGVEVNRFHYRMCLSVAGSAKPFHIEWITVTIVVVAVQALRLSEAPATLASFRFFYLSGLDGLPDSFSLRTMPLQGSVPFVSLLLVSLIDPSVVAGFAPREIMRAGRPMLLDVEVRDWLDLTTGDASLFRNLFHTQV